MAVHVRVNIQKSRLPLGALVFTRLSGPLGCSKAFTRSVAVHINFLCEDDLSPPRCAHKFTRIPISFSFSSSFALVVAYNRRKMSVYSKQSSVSGKSSSFGQLKTTEVIVTCKDKHQKLFEAIDSIGTAEFRPGTWNLNHAPNAAGLFKWFTSTDKNGTHVQVSGLSALTTSFLLGACSLNCFDPSTKCRFGSTENFADYENRLMEVQVVSK
jgi:hypothetical protein